MSNEEQAAIAGRLLIERAEAQKRIALLHGEIGRIAGRLVEAAAPLTNPAMEKPARDGALMIVRELLSARLEQLRAHLEEYERTTMKFDQSQERLREAGLL